jgi:cytochrome b561
MMTYDRTTINFHWTSAALVVALWVIGQTADWFPRGPVRGVVWSTHFTLGAILIVIWLARIGWRARSGRRLPELGSPALAALAKVGHGLLYLGIGFVCAVGVANLFAHGSSVWGLIRFAKIDDRTLRGLISVSHEWGANLLLLLAAGHACVALAHQFVWRNGALARMWPALSRG